MQIKALKQYYESGKHLNFNQVKELIKTINRLKCKVANSGNEHVCCSCTEQVCEDYQDIGRELSNTLDQVKELDSIYHRFVELTINSTAPILPLRLMELRKQLGLDKE